ncbi:MAG: N-acetylmuramoyl-L-alanine amidase [Boseongicola sp.]
MSRLLVGSYVALAALLITVTSASAESADNAIVRLTDEGAVISDQGAHVELSIGLTKSLPWRVFTLDDPARLVVEFSELSWDSIPKISSSSIDEVKVGNYRPGWSRLVAVLREPLLIDTAELSAGEGNTRQLKVRLLPTSADEFRQSVLVEPFESVQLVPPINQSNNLLRVAIDPGHGGIDPGAEADNLVEANLTLRFARQLKETLLRSGRFDVTLTRENDEFVPLEKRMTLARSAGADVFLSLHADALGPDAGPASGMTVYTLAEEVADVATLRLAERHARNDILAGVDLGAAEDDIAIALLNLARRETTPRSEALAGSLLEGFAMKSLVVNSKPHRRGEFAVLKAAEVPSVLIELGFLSSAKDRERLSSQEWSLDAAEAIRLALELWADADFLRSQELHR